jgi:hypothetical protein
MKTTDLCVECAANGLEIPAEFSAEYLDGDGVGDGKRHRVCEGCLLAGHPQGPGYVMLSDDCTWD